MKKRFLFCAGLLMGAGLMFHSGNAMTVRAAEDVVYTNGLKKYFIEKEGYGDYNYEDVIIKTTEPIVRVTVNGREQDITAGEDFYNIWNATQKISKDGKQYVFRAIGDISKMNNVLLTPNGKYVICCYVGDGNTLAAKKTVVVDKDSPYYSHTYAYGDTNYINKSVTIKPLDNTSGIASFTVNGKKVSIKKGYTLKKKGKYTFMAKDRAGNSEERTVYFKTKKIISPAIKGKETEISLKKCKLDEWNVYDTIAKKWKTNKPAVYSGMTKYDRKTTEEMDKQAEEFYKTFNFQVKGDKWLNKDGSLKYRNPVSCNLARVNWEKGINEGLSGVFADTLPNEERYAIPDKKNKKKKNYVFIKANFKKNGKIYNLGKYGRATLRKGENVLHFAYPQGIVKVALVSYRNLSGKESYYNYFDRSGKNIRIFTYKKPLKNFSITLEKQGYYIFYFYTKDMLEDKNNIDGDTLNGYGIRYDYLYIKDNPQANGFKSNMIKAISSWDYQEKWGTPDGGFNNINSGLRKMCREFTNSPYTMRVYKNNELYKDFENVTVDDMVGTKAYDDFYYPKNVSTDDIWTFVVKDVCGNLTIYKNVRIKRGYEVEATPKPTKKPHPTKKPRPTAWVTASPTATPSPTSTLPSTPTPDGN